MGKARKIFSNVDISTFNALFQGLTAGDENEQYKRIKK
jgi:hypothetical protein